MQILPRRSTSLSLSLAAIPTSNAAAQVRRNWADITEEVNPGAEEGFTLVQGRKRRRGSGNSPTTAAPSSIAGASRTIRRPQSSAGSVPRAQEIRATRAHIADARARQASSSEEHCVYIEHSPELEPFHYLRALDRKLGGTAGVIQITKVNGHQLLGLTNRGLAERLISEGLEVEGTLLRAFPFRKRAERITVGNLPFFVADFAVITALSPYGRVTSIAPKQMKVGPYVYVDGRRDVFITLHEGITIERLPTRLDINIKGQAWPAYLSSGIRCSRCHGQGHRRAICPLLAGLANNTRMAPPTTPAGVPPLTTSAPPQRSAAQPPAPAPSNLAMEVCSAPPMARAVLHPSAPRPSPPAAPALPMEETPSAPPPVIPAPPLQAPEGPVGPRSAGSQHPEPPPARPDFVAPRDPLPAQKTLGPAAPTPDVEMSIVEETPASFTSLAKNATRVDLDAFIERHPCVSFAGTDALGLGREEVLDLLSSRTKAQRKGPHLSPPQCDALAGLIGQILDLRPGAASNLYKVLGQVKAELRTTPAAVPTPPPPAPRPAETTSPALHGERTSPDIATPPPPLSTQFIDACYDQANGIIYALSRERFSEPLSNIGVTEGDIVEAIIFPEDREPLFRHLSTQKRTTLAEIISAASERARNSDPFVRVLDRLRFLPIKKMDQRTCIKFCVKNEIKCADAFRMLTVAYGEATLDRSNVYRWYKMFLEGREDVNDEERAGRPSTSTTDEKNNEVEKMRVITGDQAWVYDYDVETKAQSSQWKLPHEPRPKKARQVRSNVKVLLTVFFDCRGVVHHEFLPQGRTVNKEYYLQVMRNLREAIRQKRPDLWKNKNWLLHHDNAPAHTSLLVRDFLAKNNTLMMPQPPYSPDLAPCDLFLFPKLKRPMKGRRYATLDEIKTESKGRS
ncbi:hypothetical protein LAZ67_3003783 [Cordylochernes scorpioides]|uniref:Mos1 transposase HTH domain-containing protein n=1 Tax=Cordylochernes scorpioides TaxID=51811 RepID=A0ABY6KBP1_9ARAC|nr:hypothetical protein LAZ67_3003783 [Cordylochernes scorpioides]